MWVWKRLVWSCIVFAPLAVAACGESGDGGSSGGEESDSGSEPGSDDGQSGRGEDASAPEPSSEDASAPASAADASIPSGGALNSPEDVLMRIIVEGALDMAGDNRVVEITSEPLSADELVVPVEGESSFEPQGDYWFAFVNNDSIAAYEHDVDFVFVDAATGDVTVEPQSWWPEMGDGEDFVTVDRPLVKMFPAAVPPEDTEAPDVESDGTPRTAWWVFFPDYEDNTLDARLLVLAEESDQYINVSADLDGDGAYEDSSDGKEWLVENFAVPATGVDWQEPDPDDPDASDEATGWVLTERFAMPLNGNNKFPGTFWTRVAASAAEVGDDWDGVCDDCGDFYFDFQAWSDPDAALNVSADGDGMQPPTPGPEVDWSFFLDLFSAQLQKAPCAYLCQPGRQQIDTSCQALVINLGDRPGETMMTAEAAATINLFERRYSRDAVAVVNEPTVSRAISEIQSFVQSIQCLDEAQLYIIGHGAQNGAGMHASNGGGFVSPEGLKAVLDTAEHCPDMALGPQSEECRQTGYCDLSISIMSCFAGNFTTGANSIARPGVNTWLAASAALPAWGNQREGMNVGIALRAAFEAGAGTLQDAAGTATSSYQQQGPVQRTNARGQKLFRRTNGRLVPVVDIRNISSSPEYTHGADCNCSCSTCGDGVVDESTGEQCEPPNSSSADSCPSNMPDCGEQCECTCNLQCEAPFSLEESLCECVCDRECPSGYTLDSETCECECTRECDPGYALNTDTCECDCVLQCEDGYTLDSNACECQCTRECPTNYMLDPTTCTCSCALTQADCDAQGSGLIFDSESCSCIPHCGNGVLDSALGEECDNGLLNDGMTDVGGEVCRDDCTLAVCGDGILDPGEECDNGAQNGVGSGPMGDFCTSECTIPTCGDDVVDDFAGEECDPPGGQSSQCGSDNMSCNSECMCECTLDEAACNAQGGTFDATSCSCVDYCGIIPAQFIFAVVMISTIDPNGHFGFARVALGPIYDLLMTILFSGAIEVQPAGIDPTTGTWSTPGVPTSDIVAMSGTLAPTQTGCGLQGTGSGTFAGFGGSQCSLDAEIAPDGTASGTYTCTPSGFPGQPITYVFDATVQ